MIDKIAHHHVNRHLRVGEGLIWAGRPASLQPALLAILPFTLIMASAAIAYFKPADVLAQSMIAWWEAIVAGTAVSTALPSTWAFLFWTNWYILTPVSLIWVLWQQWNPKTDFYGLSDQRAIIIAGSNVQSFGADAFNSVDVTVVGSRGTIRFNFGDVREKDGVIVTDFRSRFENIANPVRVKDLIIETLNKFRIKAVQS